MNSRDLINETNLALIAKNPEPNPHFLLFAVIVDISEPKKYDDDAYYVTRLKVVDPSLNHTAIVDGTKLRFFKYAHIKIYTATPEQLPHVKHLGDIIRLRRFNFYITERKYELQATEKTSYSNWLIYSGEPDPKDPFVAYSFKNIPTNRNRECTEYEKKRIYDLCEWSVLHFSKYPIRQVIW